MSVFETTTPPGSVCPMSEMETTQPSPPISFNNLPSKLSDEWLAVHFQSGHEGDGRAQCGSLGPTTFPSPFRSFDQSQTPQHDTCAAQSPFLKFTSTKSALCTDSGCCDCSQHIDPEAEDGDHGHRAFDDDLDDVSSIVSCTSSCTPLPVRDYFHLSRAAFVARERVDDFDFEQETRLQASPSGNPKNAASSEKRQRLFDSWYSKQCQVDEQRQECLLQGLDPERFRYRRRSRGFGFDDGEVGRTLSTGKAAELDYHSNESDRLDSIRQWLEQSTDYVVL